MQKYDRARAGFRRLPLTAAIIIGLHSGVVFAQEATQTPQPAEESEQELERVVVTGSLIKRKEYDTINPVQTITAAEKVTVGAIDTADILQSTSIASGTTQINNQFSGFVIEGGTGVQTLDLRGLGAARSLILVNGHRPGPAGTRGQVGAFDLNVIPSTILQRVEILKDGSSSIYGSDALGGVVNLITRRNIDSPEVTVSGQVPVEGGGENYLVSGATGWNFETGNVAIAAEYALSEPLRIGDRDFLKCPQDLVRDSAGNIIDRQDRSVIAGTPLAGCNNLYANTVIDAFTGARYIPSPNGVTIGLIPGFRPRVNRTYATGQAYYEDVLNYDFIESTQVIDRQERSSLYSSANFRMGEVNLTGELLFNQRETSTHSYRQFFPLVGGATAPFAVYRYADSPTYVAPVPSGVAQPIMPFPSDNEVKVKYGYARVGLDGLLGDNWSWQADLSHSRSDGRYSNLGIVASRSGDVEYDTRAPRVNYFDPGFLNGTRMAELVNAVGEWHTGRTVYDQTHFRGLISGDMFSIQDRPVAGAIGVEHRRFSIDDTPSQLSRDGELWGSSSAQVTKGSDNVSEIFGEIELPLLAGLPAIESFTVNASARAFKYDTLGDSEYVWKIGAAWQITPAWRLRATTGTSFRAPGLYELYLGNQTGFQSQLAIDPCVQWGESTNDFVRQNCAAAGIPDTYAGGASSATIVSGGGLGVLKPEDSKSFSGGFIFTPTSVDFSIAVDYFDIEVIDQIGQLGPAGILGGCYGSPVFPNAFCGLFDRNSATDPTAPFAITTVRDSYLNINKQRTRGYDMLARYETDLAAGNLVIDAEATYVLENFQQLFDPSVSSGFANNRFEGAIGNPKLTGNLTTSFKRNDWRFTWGANYIHGTRNLNLSPTFTYFGFANAQRDIRAERQVLHSFSVAYEQPKWSALIGIRNLLDQEPPTVSTGAATRYGNIPAFATQYDWYGRTVFARFNYKF